MSLSKLTEYTLLDRDEKDAENDEDVAFEHRELRWRSASAKALLPFIGAGSLLLNIGLLMYLLLRPENCPGNDGAGFSGYRSTINEDIKASSAYSPILDAIDLSPRLQTFNGAFHDNTSIYRQPPSPEVDAAWEYLSMEGHEILTVSADAILLSGKDPSLSVETPASWYDDDAGSDDGAERTPSYPAQIDVFHQIHCLNQLRKEAYYDDYFTGQRSRLQQAHLGHCLHMLLQSLMCAADVGIVQHNWVHNERLPDPKTRPMPDFSLVKKCRDFEALRAWAMDKSIKRGHERWNAMRIPEGATVVPGDGYV